MKQQQGERPSLLGLLLAIVGVGYLALYLLRNSQGDDLMRGIALFLFAAICLGALRFLSEASRRIGGFFTALRAARRGDSRGSAGWLSEQEARREGLHKRRKGSRFAGVLGRSGLWLWTETHHLILGPAGSAKTSAAILNILCSVAESCLVNDTKGELYEVTARFRAKVFGHRIVKLDPKDRQSSRINPLDFIHTLIMEEAAEALTLLRGMPLQLYPEPPQEGMNKFFRDGARRLIAAVVAAVAVVCPPERRNLAMVYRGLTDMDLLNDLLMEAAKSPLLKGEVRAMADDVHQMAFGEDGAAKTFEQFRIGSLQAMEPFGPGGHLATITSETTFDFAELKTGKVTCYIIVDHNNKDVLGKWSGLMQWLAAYQMVRVRNNSRVTMVLDEFCNAPLYSLPSILTLLRSYGVCCAVATQDLDDIDRVYGKPARSTILSESHIKQFLGGIRSQSTLEFLAKYMGEFTEHAPSYAFGGDRVQESMGRTNRALLTADEIRRLDDRAQIVIYGNLKPALLSKVQVYAVAPWRRQIGINTMYGKKRYLRPVEVIMRGRRAYVTRRGRFEQKRRWVFWPLVTYLWDALIPGRLALMVGLLIGALWLAGFPYVRVEYAYSGSWSNPTSYSWCSYLGPEPFTQQGGECPFILFRKLW